MIRLGILLLSLLALGGIAHAAGLTGYPCQGWGLTVIAGPSVCGSAPPPASCSNSLDFSDACNSQYIGAL